MRGDASTRGDLDIHLITALEDVEDLEEEWNRLYERTHASPFCSFEWIRNDPAWSERPPNLSFCIAVVRQGRDVVSILPLAILRERFATWLSLMSSAQAPIGTIMIAPETTDQDVLLTVCDQVRRSYCRWDYCVFTNLCTRSPPYGELRRSRAGSRLESGFVGENIRIDLPGSWEDYRRSLSRAQRKSVAERTRRLAKHGEVRLVRVGLSGDDGHEEIDRRFDDALVVCRRSWQGMAEGGRPISHPRHEAFYRRVSRDMARRRRLDLSVLYVDERPVCFRWALSRFPVVNLVTTGFDPEFRSSSPGVVHTALLIRDSIDRGFSTIDMGHEFVESKRRWSSEGDELYTFTYYAHPRWSRLRRRVQQRWNRSVLPRLSRLRER